MLIPRPGTRAGSARLVGIVLAVALASGALPDATALAQSHRLRFDTVGRSEGLSQVSILAVLQDRRGFLWLGTQDGLNRYDGYGMTVFRHDPDDPASLSESWVNGLYEDRDGALWIVTRQPGVLNRFDPVTERFTRYLHDPEDPATLAPSPVNPSALWDDGEGTLWIGTLGAGLLKLDRATGRVTRLPSGSRGEEEIPGRFVSALVESRAGELWIGTFDAGLARRRPALPGSGERFEVFRHDPEAADGLSHDRVVSITEDRAGNLWIGTGAGLDRFDRATGRFQGFRCTYALVPSSAALPRPVQEDRRGRLWLVSEAGVGRLDPAAGTVVDYRHDPDVPHGLGRGPVRALQVDRRGDVWVGTEGGGLSLYQPERDGFRVVRHRPGDRYGLSSDLVTTIFEDRSGLLWIGTTEGGLSKYGIQSNRFTHHASNPFDPQGLADDMVWALLEDRGGRLWVGTLNGGLHRLGPDREAVQTRFGRMPGTLRDLGSDHVRSVLEDRRGRIWVGTFGAGLARLDPEGDRVEARFTHVPGGGSSLSSDSVYDLFEDRRGALWVGTVRGWNRLDPDTGVVTRFLHDPGDPTSLPGDAVRTTYEGRDGTLWVGTEQGLGRFDPETGTFRTYRRDLRDPHGLGSDIVLDVHQDDAGFLWLATYGGGLERLDPETGRCRHFTTRDGLPNDSVYSVLPDGEGHYWLSTNDGLARFDPVRESFRVYGVEDGLQDVEFNAGAFFQSPRGELFFGGTNGFNTFVSDDLPTNRHVPPVVLTRFRIFGGTGTREILGGALTAAGGITLSHEDRYVSFEFAALDFARPERNGYAYRLEGFDPGWIDSRTRRRADYTNLPPGRYVFRVKGSNGDGVWNEEGAALRVVVVPPPWRRWWAYALYGVAVLGMVSGYARFRTLTHRRELEQERVAAENRRKTEELEEARRLQLAMLPERPPVHPALAISATMRTATEVGGDFYDFYPQEDGSLYVVTGDATGHGLSAGMMVAMVKSALKALEARPPDRALARLDGVLRAVHPEHMQMALSLAHVTDSHVALASAGMPPAFLHRSATGEVEEILLPALPLGSGIAGRYRQRELDLAPGDTLLLVSDGLPELLDPADRPLGYDAIPSCLAAHADRPPEEVVGALLELGDRWARGRPQEDDVTLVVIRRRKKD